MDQNELTGSLPQGLPQLSVLEEVDFSDNAFNGGLPTEWNTMSQLKVLRVNDGRGSLGGELLSFESLTRLSDLELANNNFTGTIPTNFLSSLPTDPTILVKLGGNQFEGTIPSELARFSSMTLYLEDNRIVSIPEIVCENDGWMGGQVGLVPEKCDAILCPPNTWSFLGRASVASETVCLACNSSKFYGATFCGNQTEARKNIEVEILDHLFQATGGRFWTKPHLNWTRPYVPICYREGVRCSRETPDPNSGVFELVLNGFGLRGTIPSDIFDLPYIRGLQFLSNPVDISLERIGNAKRLETLRLSGTKLGSLEGVQNAGEFFHEIYAENNGLKGSFPTGLVEVGSLRGIYLAGNM